MFYIQPFSKETETKLHKMTIPFYTDGIEESKKIILAPSTTLSQLSQIQEQFNARFEPINNSFRMIVKESFEQFMEKVDIIILRRTGRISSDFEDYDWMTEYESECDPSDSVSEFLMLNYY